MIDADYNALARAVRENLELIKRNLEIAHSGIEVAAGTLRYQAADRDIDVAEVLEQFVANRVYRQIESMEVFLRSLDPAAPTPEGIHFELDRLEALQ